MSAQFRLLVCTALALTTGACAQPAVPSTGQGVTRDIVYTADATGSYRGDLYLPGGSGPSPAIVMIHGGSWRSGSKRDMRNLATDLAIDGYASFSIDYDLHPRSFPASWQESRAAVQFLRAHALEYHLDPNRIAVLGTSAGGQLAALVALAPQGPSTGTTASASAPIPVAAAVIFNGGFDLHPNAYVLRRYLGGHCEALPGVCTDASPDDHVHPDAPPFFVGHGDKDRLIPYFQAARFIALLRAAGDNVTPFIATGAGHSYWQKRRWYERNLRATETFLNDTLRSPH